MRVNSSAAIDRRATSGGKPYSSDFRATRVFAVSSGERSASVSQT